MPSIIKSLPSGVNFMTWWPFPLGPASVRRTDVTVDEAVSRALAPGPLGLNAHWCEGDRGDERSQESHFYSIQV